VYQSDFVANSSMDGYARMLMCAIQERVYTSVFGQWAFILYVLLVLLLLLLCGGACIRLLQVQQTNKQD
jgi:hypothetical protein